MEIMEKLDKTDTVQEVDSFKNNRSPSSMI